MGKMTVGTTFCFIWGKGNHFTGINDSCILLSRKHRFAFIAVKKFSVVCRRVHIEAE